MTGAYGGAQQYEISVRGHLGETMRSAFPALRAQRQQLAPLLELNQNALRLASSLPLVEDAMDATNRRISICNSDKTSLSCSVCGRRV